jgi:hypothetical protein
VFLLIPCLCGCAKKHKSREDIESALKSVRSIAGETELFIHQIDDGRISNTFAAEHFKYLRDQDRDVQEDLASASRPGEDLLIREAQGQADALSQELGRLESSPISGADTSLGLIKQIQEKTRALEASLR